LGLATFAIGGILKNIGFNYCSCPDLEDIRYAVRVSAAFSDRLEGCNRRRILTPSSHEPSHFFCFDFVLQNILNSFIIKTVNKTQVKLMPLNNRVQVIQNSSPTQLLDTRNEASKKQKLLQVRIGIQIPQKKHPYSIISNLNAYFHLEVNILGALRDWEEGSRWLDIELNGSAKQIDSALIYLSAIKVVPIYLSVGDERVWPVENNSQSSLKRIEAISEDSNADRW
jgi:hypothetical protein